MFRGVYTATSGMIASERRQQALTNHLANAETPGYKRDEKVLRAFPEMLIQRIRDGRQHLPVQNPPRIGNAPATVGRINTGVYAQEGIHDFGQGDIQETNRPYDMAIVDQSLPVNPDTEQQGNLFFAVRIAENEEGEPIIRYTRNGNFSVDQAGRLTTAEGYIVLDEDLNEIDIAHDGFQVTDNGTIVLNPQDAADDATVRLWIGYTEQPDRLRHEGNGLYQWVAEAGLDEEAEDMDAPGVGGEPQFVDEVDFLAEAPAGESYYIHQGALEGSNVDPARSMSDMLNMYRAYEANQRVLQAYDRSMEMAANQVGRLG